MVLYGFLEISKTVIGVAKITVRCSFSCPVSHLSEIFEAYFKVFYGVLEIFKVEKGVANIATSSSVLSPCSSAILLVFPRLQVACFWSFSVIRLTSCRWNLLLFQKIVVVVTIFCLLCYFSSSEKKYTYVVVSFSRWYHFSLCKITYDNENEK